MAVASIDRVIVDAVLAGQIRAGTRLQEQGLSAIFGVSRTLVREALIRLETRGIVQSSPRPGWFVIEPSLEEAQEAFQARRVIEMGILGSAGKVGKAALATLRAHLAQEREAIANEDVAARSFPIGDFHICLAEALGATRRWPTSCATSPRERSSSRRSINRHTTRPNRATSTRRSSTSFAAGKLQHAADLMISHIGNVEAGLTKKIDTDPLFDLRNAPRSATCVR